MKKKQPPLELISPRVAELLEAAAAAMADGRDPFSEWFLDEHDVSLEDVYHLGDTIAIAIRGYLRAEFADQLATMLAGSAENAEEGLRLRAAVPTMMRHYTMERITEDLKGQA